MIGTLHQFWGKVKVTLVFDLIYTRVSHLTYLGNNIVAPTISAEGLRQRGLILQGYLYIFDTVLNVNTLLSAE